jgi:hypothetical protein
LGGERGGGGVGEGAFWERWGLANVPSSLLLTPLLHSSPSPQARMARGIHGLPKVSPGPAIADPSMPCEQAPPKLLYGWRWPARRAGDLRLFSPLFGHPTPYAHVPHPSDRNWRVIKS